MSERLSEQQLGIQTETTGAEDRLTPAEQEVMRRAKESILGPLSLVEPELSEGEVKAVLNYAEKVAQAAVEEFRRLQKESPARRIIEALNEQLASATDEQRRFITSAIREIEDQVQEWRDRITVAQGIAAMMGETKTQDQIVRELIELQKKQGWGGIIPITVLVTDGLIGRGKEGAQIAEGVLRELGFLREEVSIEALFTLYQPLFYKRCIGERRLRWRSKPTRISPDEVIGLSSDSIPGVFAALECTSCATLRFYFSPEAIIKSITEVFGVPVT